MDFNKDMQYFQNVRIDLLKLIPKNKTINRVLEIGCGDGSTGYFLKRDFGVKEIVGIEVNEAVKEEAKKKLDQVIITDIEELELSFEDNYFDCILLADVLEHLYDPWTILQKVYPLLKESGFILASIPNIQHWSILLKLISGKWDYTNTGILDVTHIRFFTEYSIKRMFIDAKYAIERNYRSMGKIVCFLNLITLKLFNNFLTFRYLILASKI